jgi:hypothetical protein
MSQIREYYTVKTSYSHYYAEIYHQYPTIDKIYFGGKRKCVSFTIYLDEPNPNLDALGYCEQCHDDCTIKQIGTKHMVLSAFAFVKQLYGKKGVSQKFQLKDASYISCFRYGTRYDMPLTHYCLLHHNKAWYERVFQAVPVAFHDEYQEKKRAWKALKMTKPNMSQVFAKISKEKMRQQVIELYETSTSLQEFLKKTKDYDCMIYKDWGEIFVNAHLKYMGTQKPVDMFIHVGSGHNVISDGIQML